MTDDFTWSETERIFEALMTSCDLSVEEKAEVDYWCDHREFEIALETLADILSGKPVPKETIQRIKVLAIHMDLTEFSLAGLVEMT
jgi:hypothetical protein